MAFPNGLWPTGVDRKSISYPETTISAKHVSVNKVSVNKAHKIKMDMISRDISASRELTHY